MKVCNPYVLCMKMCLVKDIFGEKFCNEMVLVEDRQSLLKELGFPLECVLHDALIVFNLNMCNVYRM